MYNCSLKGTMPFSPPRRRCVLKPLAILAAIIAIQSLTFSNTIYVPDDYQTIQGAIDASNNGDSVIVRPGAYVENIDFKGKAIQLKSEMGPEVTVIDGSQSGSVVHFQNNEGNDSILEGFTLTNGSGTYSYVKSVYAGGGILCDVSSPTITGNVISENFTRHDGGGIYCSSDSSPIISHNRVSENSADSGRGGGIACYESNAKITNNVIRNNKADNMVGGGIWCFDSSAMISSNFITQNLGDDYGGGIHCHGDSTTIVNNIICKNYAMEDGGGISCSNSASPIISNNIIVGNFAFNYGGGLYCDGSTPTITNNTITANRALDNGGGIYSTSTFVSHITVANTILWGNKAPTGPEMWIGDTLSISYSDLEGGQSSVFLSPGATLNWGSGMIDAYPKFVDAQNGDLHLTWDSPCKNMGDDSAVVDIIDFEGDPRIALDRVDIGADEFWFHLYHTGDVIPGSFTNVKVVGAPTMPVIVGMGSGIHDPPYQTQYGSLYLQLPLPGHWILPNIPVTGVLSFSAPLPLSWSAGDRYPFQALVGPLGSTDSRLTNLMVLEVDSYHPPVVHVPDDATTIQDAIENVADDGVVIVRPGTYVENIDFCGKAITVRSEQGAAVTIIDGNRADSVVSFRSFEDENSVLDGFTITNGSASAGAGIHCEAFTSPTITNNIIRLNEASSSGGGIFSSFSSSPTITNNIITENLALSQLGGGIFFSFAFPTIANNTISYNSAENGGGIGCSYSSATITNNTIFYNSASFQGGGICFYDSSLIMTNNTISYNLAVSYGGGVACVMGSAASITNTILWYNSANSGPEISIRHTWDPSTLTISYSDVFGGRPLVHAEWGCTLKWNAGMIDTNPLFVTGPLGDFYLSQIAAGQASDSPCVDAGDPLSLMIDGTTRTDEVQDSGLVDMGYHYPIP